MDYTIQPKIADQVYEQCLEGLQSHQVETPVPVCSPKLSNLEPLVSTKMGDRLGRPAAVSLDVRVL